jgi:hypothetical protein
LPVAKSLKVTLVDANGNVNSVPLATTTTGALESGGNLASLRSQGEQSSVYILGLILQELRVVSYLLQNGLNLGNEDVDNLRTDRTITQIDSLNS